MNHVLHEGAGTVQYAWVLGVMTVVFMAAFIGWAYYALSKKNRARFEEAANMPLTDGDE